MISNFVYYVSIVNFFVISVNKYVINQGRSIITHYSCKFNYTWLQKIKDIILRNSLIYSLCLYFKSS